MNATLSDAWTRFGPLVWDIATDVVAALIIVIVGWIVAAWVNRGVRRTLSRFGRMDRTLIGVTAAVARYFVLITVFIMVLGRFGVQTASILAALGAIGLAIGLAMQGMLASIASGVMLLALRPFQVGDYVSANGHDGTVDEIGLFTTEMTTYDGLYRSVPNSAIWGGPIVNYSRYPTRRHDLVVRIAYHDDIGRAQRVLLELLQGDSRVRYEPYEPEVLVQELADSAVTIDLRFWTSADDFWPAAFDLRKAAKQTLDAHGLTIPFPQRGVYLSDSGTSNSVGGIPPGAASIAEEASS